MVRIESRMPAGEEAGGAKAGGTEAPPPRQGNSANRQIEQVENGMMSRIDQPVDLRAGNRRERQRCWHGVDDVAERAQPHEQHFHRTIL